MSLSTDLDDWQDAVAEATGLRVTRDPSTVYPPCIFVSITDATAGTLTRHELQLPVYLIAPGPGKPGGDWLLDGLFDFLDAIKATDGQFTDLTLDDMNYQAYLSTARLITT